MNTLLDQPEARPMQHRTGPLADDPAYDTGSYQGVRENLPRDSNDSSYETPTRELTLGTATILGLFFALALLCAVFFGFGYSIGSRHSVAAGSAAVPVTPAISAAKPSPGLLGPVAHIAPQAPTETVTVPVIPTIAPVLAAPAAAESTHRSPESTPILTGTAQPIVQVAAVSHQEDAELIASTLKRRGYAVAIRSEPQDKLLHLQLGPFLTKKDAEAMRQSLLADGFNAYIK